MIIEAVRNSVGIGFVPSFLVQGMIKRGELVNILDISCKTGYNYYLLHNDNNADIKAFCAWIAKLIN